MKSLNKQHGVILIFALVLLGIMSFVAVSSFGQQHLNIKIGHNHHAQIQQKIDKKRLDKDSISAFMVTLSEYESVDSFIENHLTDKSKLTSAKKLSCCGNKSFEYLGADDAQPNMHLFAMLNPQSSSANNIVYFRVSQQAPHQLRIVWTAVQR